LLTFPVCWMLKTFSERTLILEDPSQLQKMWIYLDYTEAIELPSKVTANTHYKDFVLTGH